MSSHINKRRKMGRFSGEVEKDALNEALGFRLCKEGAAA